MLIMNENSLIREAIRNAATCNSMEEFVSKTKAVIQTLGYSDFDIGLLGNAKKVDCIYTTLPNELFDTYQHERIYQQDLMLDHIICSHQAVFHSVVYKGLRNLNLDSDAIRANEISYQIMSDNGFNDSYCIPIKGKYKGKQDFVFSFLARGVPENKFRLSTNKQTSILKALAVSLCAQIESNCNLSDNLINNTNTKKLTKRQEVILLALASWAPSHKVIADHLGISENTVRNHVADIKNALNACSITNAYYIAIKERILDPPT